MTTILTEIWEKKSLLINKQQIFFPTSSPIIRPDITLYLHFLPSTSLIVNAVREEQVAKYVRIFTSIIRFKITPIFTLVHMISPKPSVLDQLLMRKTYETNFAFNYKIEL